MKFMILRKIIVWIRGKSSVYLIFPFALPEKLPKAEDMERFSPDVLLENKILLCKDDEINREIVPSWNNRQLR